MDDQDDFQKEIEACFLIEAGELLDLVESFLLALEKNQSDKEAFDALLRVMHSLKGGGRAVGFTDISNLGHEAESLLVVVRTEKLELSVEIMSLLLKCCDRLKQDIEKLKVHEIVQFNYSDLIQSLKGAANPAAQILVDTQVTPALNTHPASPVQAVVIPIAVNKPSSPPVQAEEFVRVSLKKIEDLLNNFGEQVILQATLDHLKYDLYNNQDLVLKTINQLSKLTYDLQQTTIALRMVCLKQMFSRLERTARDTAVEISKKIQFTTEGQENELDKTIVESILDPLTHMVRNAVDHGLETEAERIQKGKDPCGKVTLKGSRRGGFFYITIEDDGKGLDKDKIFQKAVKAGLVRSDAILTDSEIYDLIYANGISTRDAATSISGRGVGMNVVKESIRALKGTCHIESEINKGTRFTIRLPLTLAIFNGVVTRVSNANYVIPNSDVERILAYPSDCERIISDKGEKVISLDDSILPLVDLREKLNTGISHEPHARGTIIIVHTAESRHALLVDEVIAQQRIVHKTLGSEVKSIKGASGATILGDGSAAIILDISALITTEKKVA